MEEIHARNSRFPREDRWTPLSPASSKTLADRINQSSFLNSEPEFGFLGIFKWDGCLFILVGELSRRCHRRRRLKPPFTAAHLKVKGLVRVWPSTCPNPKGRLVCLKYKKHAWLDGIVGFVSLIGTGTHLDLLLNRIQRILSARVHDTPPWLHH